jgi:glycosyltransferase involved in cell wall biosynthesis
LSIDSSFNKPQLNTKYPLVTIITVVYNGIEFIEETIKNVINQSFENFEYIVVDGGSTDGTLEIIQKYESYISKWISEPDNGIYDAMNKGIKLATGSWLNFMNAGDSFYSNQVLQNVFENDFPEDVSVIYGDTDIGHKILKYKQNLDLNSMAQGMMLCHQSTFYRSSETIRYNLKYKICGDQDFTMQYFASGKKACYLDLTVSKYDLEGISSQSLNKILKEKLQINKSYGLMYTPVFKSYIISILVKVRKAIRGY